MIKVGTCGWGYYPEPGDKLINYAKHFVVGEANSTFYRLPKVSTAEKWREKADSVNKKFEFTVKVWRAITHYMRFRGKESIEYFERVKEIAHALRAKVLVFQTPASFVPSKSNIQTAKKFFEKIDRESFKICWEVRWANKWTEEIVKPLFKELDICHVVDPFRQDSYYPKFGYYRLHGFGKSNIYAYTYSDKELRELAGKIKKGYVMFNNYTMYEDAERFIKLLRRK